MRFTMLHSTTGTEGHALPPRSRKVGAIKADLGADPAALALPLVKVTAGEAGSLEIEKPVGESRQGSRCLLDVGEVCCDQMQ